MWTFMVLANIISFFISSVFSAAVTTIKPGVVAVDIGNNLTLPCPGEQGVVSWIRDGREPPDHSNVQDNGSLGIWDVQPSDIIVRTPPPPLVNVTTHMSTVLGLVLWNVNGSGGYPIIDFTAEYKLHSFPNGSGAPENETWKIISPAHMSPNTRQIDIYHLIPNTTYAFRVWATNALGPGEKVEVLGATLYFDGEAELARHLLTGADQFDTRVWVAAVAVVMGTLTVLTFGTCLLLYKECRAPNEDDMCLQETMELVPNIILNPGYCEMRSEANANDIRYSINNSINEEILSNGRPFGSIRKKRNSQISNGYMPVNSDDEDFYPCMVFSGGSNRARKV
ncbi:uncharacterized protein LOC113381154 [Ctenocephalides felis]|uniref:uncharacterized protein LOC113381126 n=1 Tax=Ctenocephalides felis TaxID=7515 RepID=UPI000E6E46AE|nr:uncharacterized protein LOC113381126 [Ctenocephalides felis]XP_026475918.1 uncharacterized protein LOC113381154 [Ctenocephalides felis]